MKGKGKGDRSSTSEYKTEKADSPIVSFPDVPIVDHAKHCPRYTAVLSRPKDELIGLEELDFLQTELEHLLASAAKCMKVLHGELEPPVENIKDTKPAKESKGKDIKGKGSGKGKREEEIKEDPGTPSKRGSSGKDKDETPSKKFKGTPGKGTPSRGPKGKEEPGGKKGKGTPNNSGKDKGQSVEEPPPPPDTPDTSGEDMPMLPVALAPTESTAPAPVRIPKNDAPNRFWNMVEPYCAEITTEDLKVLEDIMRSHEDDVEFYKVPPVGKHYSEKWAHEDMLEEQRQGQKLNDKKKNSSGSSGATDLLKRVKDNENADSPFGPLTQRLVQALIEENIMAPLDDTSISEADAAEAATISPRSLAKQLNIGNTAAIERRIKRELEENGILEPDDKTSEDDPNDEILSELKKKQAELKAISQHNMMVTTRLYKLAKEEMARQDLHKKLIVADAEVMDAYRKIQATRQKNKSPSKKEVDAAKRALKERDSLVRQLESSL